LSAITTLPELAADKHLHSDLNLATCRQALAFRSTSRQTQTTIHYLHKHRLTCTRQNELLPDINLHRSKFCLHEFGACCSGCVSLVGEEDVTTGDNDSAPVVGTTGANISIDRSGRGDVSEVVGDGDTVGAPVVDITGGQTNNGGTRDATSPRAPSGGSILYRMQRRPDLSTLDPFVEYICCKFSCTL